MFQIDPLMEIPMFIAALTALALSSHFTIKYVEKFIELTGLSEASVGFTVLAVLTSTPELAIALFSILQGTPGISVGDILGSNIFNFGFVLGVLGMLGYFKVCCTKLWIELTDYLLIISLIPILLVLSYHHLLIEIPSFIVGILLLATFFYSIYQMSKQKTPRVSLNNLSNMRRKDIKIILAKMILSIIFVVVAARVTASSGLTIAHMLGAPPILIGTKVIAIGTSLPELTLDLAAVRRGRIQLAIGDIIGSNLTNLTLVLGLVLIISPFTIDALIFAETLPFLLMTTVIFWCFLVKGGIPRKGGALLSITYFLFQALVI